MTVAEVKTAFLENLLTKGYSPAEIDRQEVVLRKTFLYGLALHHPDMPRRVKRLRADEFGTGGPVTYATCETFLQATRTAVESVRYINLAALFGEHSALLPSRGRAVPSFLESLGATIDIRSVSRRLVTQLLASLDLSTSRARRAPTIIHAFLEFCFDQGWLAWNPQAAQRMPSERVFEADFFGPPKRAGPITLGPIFCSFKKIEILPRVVLTTTPANSNLLCSGLMRPGHARLIGPPLRHFSSTNATKESRRTP